MTEIGSYFEYDYSVENNNEVQTPLFIPSNITDFTYTFSGRSAIELVLMNIMKTQDIKRVYMPSYCCSSMLSPFIKHGIDIIYYDVSISSNGLIYHIDYSKDVDLFFAMSYFGVEHSMDEVIQEFKTLGITVLEDITHRLLSETSFSKYADYGVASLRKWFAIPTGGLLVSRTSINIKPNKISDSFVQNQIKAMELKTSYLNEKSVEKEEFFKLYKTLNQDIQEIDYTFKIDISSEQILHKLDVNKIKQIRRENAKILYKDLGQYSLINILQETVDFNQMTPLFVPIIIQSKEKRDKLVKYLIANQIYCPVHWPKPSEINLNNRNNALYEQEISLICDQRYSRNDMKKIIEKIGEFEQQHV